MLVYIVMIIILLAAIAGELGALIWRAGSPRPPRGGPPPGGEPEDADTEKRWREGIEAMMRYDLKAARSAARRDGDE